MSKNQCFGRENKVTNSIRIYEMGKELFYFRTDQHFKVPRTRRLTKRAVAVSADAQISDLGSSLLRS